MKLVRRAALVAVSIAAIGSIPAVAQAQTGYAYAAQNPADALASNVRILVQNPKDFNALIGAGRAALQTGDPQAAAGFYGRAQEVNPNSYLPPAGMGAAMVATGDATDALTYFTRAQQLGATVANIGADLGLAYDLLGNQVAAQSDYRAALSGPEANDARRRLALSLAISGQQSLALAELKPLLMLSDPAAKRDRAFVLALGGDIRQAKIALDYMMPGASVRMDPFFRRLASLTPAQKAAAVHLGIFPDSGAATYASATPSVATPAPTPVSAPSTDRLASIEQMLAAPQPDSDSPAPAVAAQQVYGPPAAPAQQPAAAYSPPVQVASISRPAIQHARDPDAAVQIARVAADPGSPKIWLQLASGRNAGALPQRFREIRSRDPSLFSGISGYVAEDGDKARLVIGPFHSSADARMFADALSSDHIDAFDWTSDPDQVVRKLPNQ